MRIVKSQAIKAAVSALCAKANLFLRPDVLALLKAGQNKEKNKRAKEILAAIIKNAAEARQKKLAICQDTGMPIVFLEIGQDARIVGNLTAAVNQGVSDGYRRASLRDSIIQDPLARGKPGFVPAVIHTEIVRGNKIKITVLPKGFGCENKTQLMMFKPTVGIAGIKKFIIDAVKSAGPDACPPYVVGVGIGGTADYACLLAKKALLRIGAGGRLQAISKIEKDLLEKINRLNIGPMGLGGKTTALAVKIKTYSTHIAGLPVCLNISCHALRSASRVI